MSFKWNNKTKGSNRTRGWLARAFDFIGGKSRKGRSHKGLKMAGHISGAGLSSWTGGWIMSTLVCA